MSAIVVFGAGGRAGRAVVREARDRGHRVTAVVRDPAAYADREGRPSLEADDVVAGDVTDADAIARVAAGHQAAVNAAADLAAPPMEFFPAAARALLGGLERAGVRRLIAVGLATGLRTAAGTLLMDTPGYPQEYREFYLGHEAGDAVLREAVTPVDWLVISPSGDFDHDGVRTGGYRVAPGDAGSRISYPDLAVAVLDEAERPRHHRVHLGVERA
ncbi:MULTISPECIES: NAD(P)H-binding protein [unclassified Microbispora]|uniref:NAD(P)-dependent oxidoreductase n=1 Tax=unclassified Microbispora TaxID=2614687 RepID=UPI001474D108|nr:MULTISPECIES: NAD(P)H-binding protein [unclassified Microbispora]